MAGVELTKGWWDKNKPKSLKKSELDKFVGSYEKSVVAATAKKWQIDGAMYASVNESIQAVTKALEKDMAEAKKAKDSDGEKLLRDLQKSLASKQADADKFKEIKKKVNLAAASASASGTVPAAAASAPGGGGADTIINAANAAWGIVKDGKPTLTNGSKFCQAVPRGLDFTELSGWQTYSGSHTGYWENGFGVKVIKWNLTVTFQHHGTAKKTGGAFVNNFTIFCKEASVLWGFSLDVQAAVSGDAFNAGKPGAPVGAIPLVLSVSPSGVFQAETESTMYTAYGSGALKAA
jgi:hypothetical protein